MTLVDVGLPCVVPNDFGRVPVPTNHKVTEVQGPLRDRVQTLIDSQHRREFLAVASRFHRYSTGTSAILEV